MPGAEIRSRTVFDVADVIKNAASILPCFSAAAAAGPPRSTSVAVRLSLPF
jgi:hypothetical protein